MSTALQPFAFTGQQVRVVLDEHGEPWFVAADVCRVLGHSNTSMAVASVADDERSTLSSAEGAGGPPRVTVSEAGLYRLIFTSRRPEAEAFRRWVTHEVLPSIRRTGGYGAPAAGPATDVASLDRRALALLVIEAEDRADALAAEVAELEPAAAVARELMSARGDYSLREAAQVLCRDHGIDTGQNRLLAHLRGLRWVDAKGTPYQRVIDSGRLAVRTRTWTHPHLGDARLDVQLRVTAKGLAWLHQHWGDGQLALAAGP